MKDVSLLPHRACCPEKHWEQCRRKCIRPTLPSAQEASLPQCIDEVADWDGSAIEAPRHFNVFKLFECDTRVTCHFLPARNQVFQVKHLHGLSAQIRQRVGTKSCLSFHVSSQRKPNLHVHFLWPQKERTTDTTCLNEASWNARC